MLFKNFYGILFFAIFSGCQNDQITVYQVPKENHSPKDLGTSAGTPKNPSNFQSIPLRWKTPANWQKQPATAMRQASFLIRGKSGQQADISVVSLSGLAGGDLANVNRWRSQLQLEPIDETELVRSASSLTVQGQKILVWEMTSQKPIHPEKPVSRLLGAILHYQDRSWFFKMMGEDSIVAQEKANFTEFLKSIRFSNDT